jgi:response regulator RpfG family c-di-GMP phosphodiesterase
MSSKLKLAWYELNTAYTSSVAPFFKQYFELQVFKNPKTAVEEIKYFRPDVILFDLKSREMNGIQLFLKISKEKNLDFIALFLTIWGKDESSINSIMELGIPREAIFDKDISAESLSIKIRDFIKQKGEISK